jgi:hypothetical protein
MFIVHSLETMLTGTFRFSSLGRFSPGKTRLGTSLMSLFFISLLDLLQLINQDGLRIFHLYARKDTAGQILNVSFLQLTGHTAINQ